MPRSRISRRRFLALVAAGTTAAAGGAVAATEKKTKAKSPRPAKPPVYAAPPAPSAEIARGIRQQKEWTAGSLATLRAFELPTGSEQAFAFRPMPAKKKKVKT
jgi:hypothetical protein